MIVVECLFIFREMNTWKLIFDTLYISGDSEVFSNPLPPENHHYSDDEDEG